MIHTSYFANRKIRELGLRLVAISLSVPIGFKSERYLKLAPTREMISLAHDGRTKEYTEIYTSEILSELDPVKVYKELDGSVLLCWEKAGKFCHRQIVADWLEQATGKRITEVMT